MLYIRIERNEDHSLKSADVVDEWSREANDGVESRWNWKSLDEVKAIAALCGPEYIGTDAGSNVRPRFDVQEMPKVGDDVSYSFNGDSYPCGKIKSISKTLKVIVAGPDTLGGEDRKFYRVRDTGCWRYNGTWSLIGGHVNERNPSF